MTITYKNKEYSTKELNVRWKGDSAIHTVTIAPESLSEALNMDNMANWTIEEESIDESIYHYVEDVSWNLPDEIITRDCLDSEMVLVPESKLNI